MATTDNLSFTSYSKGVQRSIRSDTARNATFDEIPLISLKAPHNQLLEQLTDACTRVGFFYIKDHDVPEEKVDAIFSMAERFFAQDTGVKNKINYKQSKILRGYEPPAEVRTDETRKPDVNEAFNWGYEKELDPELSKSSQEEGLFSRRDSCPEKC
jgi:isopenicillin N synthase-like dioxygenase